MLHREMTLWEDVSPPLLVDFLETLLFSSNVVFLVGVYGMHIPHIYLIIFRTVIFLFRFNFKEYFFKIFCILVFHALSTRQY